MKSVICLLLLLMIVGGFYLVWFKESAKSINDYLLSNSKFLYYLLDEFLFMIITMAFSTLCFITIESLFDFKVEVISNPSIKPFLPWLLIVLMMIKVYIVTASEFWSNYKQLESTRISLIRSINVIKVKPFRSSMSSNTKESLEKILKQVCDQLFIYKSTITCLNLVYFSFSFFINFLLYKSY